MNKTTAPIAIQIDYAADDSCQIQLWSKGHHPAEAFLQACEQALLAWDGRFVSLAGKPVYHHHWRTVKADAETRAYGVCETVRKESMPGRGAYAVTVMQGWLPLHVHGETMLDQSN